MNRRVVILSALGVDASYGGSDAQKETYFYVAGSKGRISPEAKISAFSL